MSENTVNKHGFEYGDKVAWAANPEHIGHVVGFHPPACGHHNPIIVNWLGDSHNKPAADCKAKQLVKL